MSMTVHHSDDLEAGIFGGSLGPEVILGIEGVDARRFLDVATREEASDPYTTRCGALGRFSGHETAGFERILGERQCTHLIVNIGTDLEDLRGIVHEAKAKTSVA